MRLSTFAFLSACAAAVGLTACGSNGFLGTAPAPDGNILITGWPNTGALAYSAAAPFQEGNSLFSLMVTEGHYNGSFGVVVSSADAGPCYLQVTASPAPAASGSTSGGGGLVPNLYTFQANSGVPASPSPGVLYACSAGTHESITFNDSHGHSAVFFLQLSSTILPGG
jgi:hypothetical protein